VGRATLYRTAEPLGVLHVHDVIRQRMLDQVGSSGPAPKPATLPRGRQRYKVMLCLADFSVLILSMLAGYRFYPVLGGDVVRPLGYAVGVAAPVLCIGVLARYGLYAARSVTTRLDEMGRLIHAWLACVVIVASLCFMANLEVSRGWAASSSVFAFFGLVFEREVARRAFGRLRAAGKLGRSVLLVGANNEGVAVCESIVKQPWLGYRIVGFVDDTAPIGSEPVPGLAVLGRVNDAGLLTQSLHINTALLVATANDADRTNEIAKVLIDHGVHVEMTTGLRDVAPERLKIRRLGRFPVMYLEPVPTVGWRRIAKRTLDIVVSTVLILLTLPILVVAAVALKLETPGPVFFRQQRFGHGGKRIGVYKLRTMVADAENQRETLEVHNEAKHGYFKVRHDPRITRVGRVLRRFSIDELPQFFNVLKGDMSLVGPRPLPVSDVLDNMSHHMAHRLRTRPGLTGMWQVSGRSDANDEDFFRLDIYYVDNWSLWVDLAVLAKTVPRVIRGNGAY